MLNINFEILSCSDMKKISREICEANFTDVKIQHFFESMEDQRRQTKPCSLHEDALDVDTMKPMPCTHGRRPRIAVFGAPCQPFTRQRDKRSVDGSVRAHSKFHVQMQESLDWMARFMPEAAISEQVEGFSQPETKQDTSNPLDRLSNR